MSKASSENEVELIQTLYGKEMCPECKGQVEPLYYKDMKVDNVLTYREFKCKKCGRLWVVKFGLMSGRRVSWIRD